DRARVVEAIARVAREPRVAVRGHHVVDHAVAVVIDVVAGGLERARTDERRVTTAVGRRIAAVATARRDAVAVIVDVLVDGAVAVVVDAVTTRLGARQHLAVARAPRAVDPARLRAAGARADALRARITRVARARLPLVALVRVIA